MSNTCTCPTDDSEDSGDSDIKLCNILKYLSNRSADLESQIKKMDDEIKKMDDEIAFVKENTKTIEALFQHFGNDKQDNNRNTNQKYWNEYQEDYDIDKHNINIKF